MRPQFLTLPYLTRYFNFIAKLNSFFSSKDLSAPRILNYHSIDNNKDLYSVTKEDLYNHMLSIHKSYHYRINSLTLKNLKNDSIFITFDDGYDNNLDIALPIMEEFQFPFTIYVTTDPVKKNKKKFLTEIQLKKISSSPLVTIGSHSKTHPYLTKCDHLELKSEIIDSKKYLEDLTGNAINSFAYPFGDVNSYVANVVEESGYDFAVTTYPGPINSINKPFYLNRNVILSHDDNVKVLSKIQGHWDWVRHLIKNPCKR